MATQLKNILRFVNLPVGVPTSVLHGLTSGDHPVVPDIITPGVGADGVAMTADALNLTVTNNNLVPVTFAVLVEHWHTIERDFGDVAILKLNPQPFVTCCGDGDADPLRLAMFYNVTPDPDFPIVVLGGEAVPFPLAGPATLASGIVPAGTNQFTIPQAGIWRVSWSVAFTAASQLQAALDGTGLPHTLSMSGASAGAEQPEVPAQNTNTVLIQATLGQLLSIINPDGLTPNASLTIQASDAPDLNQNQAPSLVIEFVQ